MTRQAIQNHIHANPHLEAVRNSARESALDLSESALYKAAQEGEGWAVCCVSEP